MLQEKTWEEFQNIGLLWLINGLLHTFGWTIVIEEDKGKIKNVYPARTSYRGFSEKTNTEGYIKVSEYMKTHADELLKEARE